jgi:tetraacyldisaccharide 4'-kinase
MLVLRIIFLPVLLPLALGYALISFVRNQLFNFKIFKTYTPQGVQVLSVGNITAGGTGKTPVTAYFAEELLKRNLKVGIISRGYGGSFSKNLPIAKVMGQEHRAAEKFGDEPTWYAQKFLQAQVYVGANRVAAAAELMKNNSVDVIIADDAFQHRRLGRHLDLVLLDASASIFDYLPLPLGRGREDLFFALQRADILILNKINLTSEHRLARLKKILNMLKPVDVPLIELKTEIIAFKELGSEQRLTFAQIQNASVILACAIAKPEQFLALMQEAGVKVSGRVFLADHAAFDAKHIDELEHLVEVTQAKYIVVTEKDAVKLKDLEMNVNFRAKVLVSELKISSKELVDAISARLNW